MYPLRLCTKIEKDVAMGMCVGSGSENSMRNGQDDLSNCFLPPNQDPPDCLATNYKPSPPRRGNRHCFKWLNLGVPVSLWNPKSLHSLLDIQVGRVLYRAGISGWVEMDFPSPAVKDSKA